MQFLSQLRAALCASIVTATVLLASLSAHATLSIANVTTDTTTLDRPGDVVRISFQLSEPARVTATFYNPYDEAVRTLLSDKAMAAGNQEVIWDGRDDNGVPVPAEAYVYTLAAATDAEVVVYDLSDGTGGEKVAVTDITYDSKSGNVRYSVEKPGRFFLRVGIENGFVLNTLINNSVQVAGEHTLTWDGWDKSKVISLNNHPKLRFYGSGYQLSRNSIIVTWKDDADRNVSAAGQVNVRTREASPRPPGLDRHAYHPVAMCRDVTLELQLPEVNRKNAEGLPIVEGSTPWSVKIKPADQMLIESERSEIVFFLDNLLLYENETSYFPYTWRWEPQGFASGTHYMTAFVVSYTEHFGYTTAKFHLGDVNSAQ